MRKYCISAITALALSISFAGSATDLNQLKETYAKTTLTKLADLAASVNKQMIADGTYAKDTDVILTVFQKEYDKTKQAVSAEIQAKKDLPAGDKAALQKSMTALIDAKYDELARSYQSTVEMRADFAKKLEADLAKLKAQGADMTKTNADLKTCTDLTIDNICSYAKNLIKLDNSEKKDSWQLGLIDKIGADTEKMKLDAKANVESNGYFYSPELKKIANLYNEQLIDSFKAFSILILRDEIVKGNALKDKDAALSISDLVHKYKFPTAFAGLYLGDSKDDVLKLFKDSKLLKQKAADKNTWADIYTYESNPVMKQAMSTTLYFTQNILVKAEITMQPPAGTDLHSFSKATRTDLEAKYGIFASINNKDADPAEIEKFRTLSNTEKADKYTPRECVKYIWGGETDTSKLAGNNRGNMLIKIKETLENKLIISAEHETLYNKTMDRFNPQNTEAQAAGIN